MSTPRGRDDKPMGADRFEQLNPDLKRGLDADRRVRSDDSTTEARKAEERIAALEPEVVNDRKSSEDVISLPDETSSRDVR